MLFKVKLFCLLAVACVAAVLSGCSSNDESRHKHFVWKVSDENSSVYLLGSVHFADASFYPLDSVVLNAFDRSNELAVEIDITDKFVVRKSMELSSDMGLLKDGRTLDKILPKDVLASLDSLLLSWDLPSDSFYKRKPWTTAMTLSSVAIQRMGFNYGFGIDLFFTKRAHAQAKNIISLESVEDQVKVYNGEGTSDSLGAFFLKGSIQEIALMDSMFALIKRAWKMGNDSLFRLTQNMHLGEYSHADSLLMKEVDEFMYVSRNRKMAESVINFLADDRSVFVVVGAGHLILGEENVVEILRKKGLTVERL